MHRFDPRIKVGGLAILSLLITMTRWQGLLLTSFALLGLVLLSRVPIKIYGSLIVVLFWVGLFYGLVTGWVWPENRAIWFGHWSMGGLAQAVDMVWRISLIFGLTRLYTAVTMPLAQGVGIAYFFNPLIRITPKAADFALLLTLTLRFIPLIVEEAILIWKVRLLKSEWPHSKIKRFWEIIQLIVPLILLSLRRAEELSENLMSRGYGSGNYRTLTLHEQTSKDRLGVLIVGVWGILLLVWR
ncbi:energy-coupling factor transporter transmembrane component T [Desulfosporosinus sp. OT]|uniref:energy-coupling factor transporter transmembrane component T family protein n=1 Tax=Desulfosporosinus sp. OT TaxID=913865 RepID=UPI000223A5C5|nr:energy-coupling factor transporter transmembrane component T [Desulfosporosinus sp. OT]EGW39837.1 cobalt transport family protein [Desulfosporosinus sp. OT]